MKRIMHDRGVTMEMLGQYLKKTRSGISKMLNRPDAVLPHLKRISHYLTVPYDQLAPPQPGMPVRAISEPTPVQLDRPLPLEEGLGSSLREKQVHVIPPGWAVVAVRAAESFDLWLCGAAGTLPRDGNRVVVIRNNGEQISGRYFSGDKEGELYIVRENERPVLLKRDDVDEMRSMFAPIGTVR